MSCNSISSVSVTLLESVIQYELSDMWDLWNRVLETRCGTLKFPNMSVMCRCVGYESTVTIRTFWPALLNLPSKIKLPPSPSPSTCGSFLEPIPFTSLSQSSSNVPTLWSLDSVLYLSQSLLSGAHLHRWASSPKASLTVPSLWLIPSLRGWIHAPCPAPSDPGHKMLEIPGFGHMQFKFFPQPGRVRTNLKLIWTAWMPTGLYKWQHRGSLIIWLLTLLLSPVGLAHRPQQAPATICTWPFPEDERGSL